MSCCNCNLFDIDCLRTAAGIPQWTQNDNESLVQAYNDVVTLELQIKLGSCFDYLCNLKQQIDDLIISEPAWWQELVNKRLLNFASKALRYYFLIAGLANGGNATTYTADANENHIKTVSASLFKQSSILWEEVKKWLNDNWEEAGIECWENNTFCEKKTCETCTTIKYSHIFTTKNKF